MASPEREYVLGTHDEELDRLGLQHRAWLPNTRAAWETAGIGRGQTVLDVGCGPGYASLDLAAVVGPSGRVVAIDKSQKFLAALEQQQRARGFENIDIRNCDFDSGDFPAVVADAAWCRWVFAFLRDPRAVLTRLAAAVVPGGTIVVHEYFDYSTWRTSPRCPELEEFVSAVMTSWRDHGGEPDIALPLLRWLEELGFSIRSRPIIDVIQPQDIKWAWVRSFLDVGRPRLVDLGYMSASRADAIWRAFTAAEATPGVRMITPGVLEIIATRRAGE